MTEIAQHAPPAAAAESVVHDAEKRTTRSGWRALVGYKRTVQAIGMLAVATAAGTGYRALTRPTAVRIGTAEMGTVREETVGPGTVQSRFSVAVGSRVAGIIDRIEVDVGDEVRPGQLLASLDRTELDARFRATRGAVASARQDVELARANLEKARSDLELARIRDERTRRLVPSGVISAADADDARAAVRAAEFAERAARAAADARQAAVGRLEDERRVAEAILSYTRLESPMAGIVTRRALEPGSAVAPGAVVFQIVDANALWVATLIDQSLAGRIAIGRPALIRLRSGAELRGHVARIALEADPVTRELEVDVAFDVRPSRFAINEEADVTIRGEDAYGVTVPIEAVHHARHGTFVYVIENDRARRHPVRLGIMDGARAQVLDGLAQGDSIVLGESAVAEGERVTAREM